MIANTPQGPHFEAEEVKRAGVGREIELLINVARSPSEYLDGQHHPCPSPECGGEGHDRFSLVDEKLGAVLCRRCFSSRNGDWLAAVMHFRRVDFPGALRLAGEYLEVQPTTRKGNATTPQPKSATKKKADSAAKLHLIDWVETFAQMYCRANPGTHPEALRRAGARMAYYYGQHTVIALPIYGPGLLEGGPVGWIVQDIGDGKLPRFDKTEQVVEWVKRKITFGSQPGVVGDAAARDLADPKITVFYKMEGVSDLLAMETCLLAEPREGHVAITTGSGAGERWGKQPWLVDLIGCRGPASLSLPARECGLKLVQLVHLAQCHVIAPCAGAGFCALSFRSIRSRSFAKG